VGCAASYDPVAQKTARAFVELLNHAEVNFAILGKKECCTGDSARRAGNEYLYRQLADKNVAALNTIQPKLIVASCPHCLNSLGHEYKQIGGDYKVLHHTEYLETLVATKKLTPAPSDATITYHDPCYLGRHNGIYDAPRNLLNILSNSTTELPRNRDNSFCCGAGGAQFWKEEEPGDQRISDNRFREAEQTLASATGEKVLAVGCPFCKSMLGSTPSKATREDIAIKDVAELLLEGVRKAKGIIAQPAETKPIPAPETKPVSPTSPQPIAVEPEAATAVSSTTPPASSIERKKWQPKSSTPSAPEIPAPTPVAEAAPAEPTKPAEIPLAPTPERKKWQPKSTTASQPPETTPAAAEPTTPTPAAEPMPPPDPPTPARKKWTPKKPT
jgi:hypothetical protein